jgi:cell wall-associated NlpC family hydrolase
MHPDRSGPQRQVHRRRTATRLLAGLLAVTSPAVAVAPMASAHAAIPSATTAINRQSPAVVREATEALWRYRRFVRLGTAASLDRYNRARNQAARATAAAMNLAPRMMVARWAAAGRRHQVAVLAALSQLGAQYRAYTADPRVGFDCSGLTYWAWHRAGVTIPRSSGDQIAAAAPRRRTTAHAGDLVYYPGHVSMYLGVGWAIVHASDPQDDVELSFISRRVRWGDPTRHP